jgi:outer membrane immunogenic protein
VLPEWHSHPPIDELEFAHPVGRGIPTFATGGDMNRTLLGAVAVLAMAGTSAATAADMPLKAPVPVVEAWSWTGFYVGLNAGGFWGHGDQGFWIDDSDGRRYYTFGAGQAANIAQVMYVGNDTLRNSGFTGGAQVGYNYQTGPWVLGWEADANWFNPDATRTRNSFLPVPAFALPGPVPVPFSITDSTSGDWLATFRIRAGIHPFASNNLMIYGTAGGAVAHVNFSSSYADGTTCPPQISCALRANINTTQDAWGFAGGFGFEWMFAPRWSVKAEYLFVSVKGSDVAVNALPTGGTIPATCPVVVGNPGFCSTFHYRPEFLENIVRVGVNYHFDWAGPVVARY